MAWYKTGTVSVTNGSATVTGAGTAFVGAVLAGHGFAAPDGKLYEVASVVSATQLTLANAYLGSTASGQSYGIFPTNGALTPFAARLDTVLSAMQGVIDGAGQGRFAAGSAATPGIAFVADSDTGFTNPAANQIGLVTGGVRRALLSNTALQLDVPLTGTAVTQTNADATAGRLLKVGDFGLGGIAQNFGPDSSWGAVAQSQFIACASSANQPIDKPNPANAIPFVGLHMMSGTLRWGEIVQEAAGSYPWRIWARTSNGGVTQDWDLLFSRKSVLGTVAQASGVPTGALIERGSNANGDYIRFADGTQICRVTTAATTGAAATWTFPAAFVAPPAVVGSALATVLSALCLDAAPATTSVAFSARDKTDARRADTCHLHAIGRWF